MGRKYFYMMRDREDSKSVAISHRKLKLAKKGGYNNGPYFEVDDNKLDDDWESFCWDEFKQIVPFLAKIRVFEQVRIYPSNVRFRILDDNNDGKTSIWRRKQSFAYFPVKSMLYIGRNPNGDYNLNTTRMDWIDSSQNYSASDWSMSDTIWERVIKFCIPKRVQIVVDLSSLEIEKINYFKGGGKDVLPFCVLNCAVVLSSVIPTSPSNIQLPTSFL